MAFPDMDDKYFLKQHTPLKENLLTAGWDDNNTNMYKAAIVP